MPKRKDKKKSLDYNKEKIGLLFELNKKLISEIQENKEQDSISSIFTIEEILSDPYLKGEVSQELHLKKMTMANTDEHISFYQETLELLQSRLDRREKSYQHELKKWENNYNIRYGPKGDFEITCSIIEKSKREIKYLELYLETGDLNLEGFQEGPPPPAHLFSSIIPREEHEVFLRRKKESLKKLIERKKSHERDQIRELEKKPKPSHEMIFLKKTINSLRENIKKLRQDPSYIYSVKYVYEVELYILREQVRAVESLYKALKSKDN